MSGMSGVAQRQVSDRIRTLGSATKNTLESNALRAAVRYVRQTGASGAQLLDWLDSDGVRGGSHVRDSAIQTLVVQYRPPSFCYRIPKR